MAQSIFEFMDGLMSAVVIFRHGSYVKGPVRAKYPDDESFIAANYSEREDPSLFVLDDSGIARAREQGGKFATAGIEPRMIFTTNQGRGPDTAIRFSEGFHGVSDQWLPVTYVPATRYPTYDHDMLLGWLRENGIKDRFVPEWFNGKIPGLISSDTPRSLVGRFNGFIEDQLRLCGVAIVASHFELVLLAHNTWVKGKEIGEFDENWFPSTNAGVLIAQRHEGKFIAADFDSSLEMVEEPRMIRLI